MSELAARQFARVLIALQPYVDEIVFVGGWVHALYLAEANDSGAVMTEDIDVTLPHTLLTRDRPTLLELARDAGFERDPISDMEEVAVWMVYRNADGLTVPIDFLTEGEPRRPVSIVGQPGLMAQGYPGQQMLLQSWRWMEVGTDVHALLDPPRRVRVPTLGAYVVQKAMSAAMRGHRGKAAKDYAYIADFGRSRSPISGEADHLFRSKPITRFGPSRSPVSVQADHSFRSKPITCFG
ncbi:MAG: hypothetical protein H7247_01875 [Polaromonas sp.]|nr:hypothetical protein [Gemmatimonadaceae bacterium]